DAVAGPRIAASRPDGLFERVGPVLDEHPGNRTRHGPVRPRDDFCLRRTAVRIDSVDIDRLVRTAAAPGQGGRGARRIVAAAGGLGGRDRPGLTGIDRLAAGRVASDVVIAAAHRPAALIVVIVTAEHEIDRVAVEERQPGLADSLVGAVALAGGAERILVHLHDDP